MRFCPVFLLASLLIPAAHAQSSAGVASITGTVHDASGAAVASAKVVISNPTNGAARNLNTNHAGVFTAPALSPASGYSVAVEAQGFQKIEVKDLNLAVGEKLSLNLTLTIVAATIEVDVSAVAPAVEATKSDVSDVIDTAQIDQLPINGRRLDSFVLLTSGVANDGYFGNLSFRGMPGNNSFRVDGVDNTEQFFNENAGRTRIATQISQDAVQEFQVLSSNF